MYIAPINEQHDIAEIKAFIKTYGFGILVSTDEGKPQATHIPLVLTTDADGNDVLAGHISKANPQCKFFETAFETTSDVMVIFSGPHAYISSSWYDHANVPTWNYIAVHIYGSLKIVDSETLLNDLKTLVNKYEAASENPVAVETMPERMVSREMRGIIGFHISINDIQAAYKLSQNREDKNHAAITNKLDQTGDAQAAAVAAAMRKQR